MTPPVSSPIRSGNDFAGGVTSEIRFALSVAYRSRTMRWSPGICCISGPSRSKFARKDIRSMPVRLTIPILRKYN